MGNVGSLNNYYDQIFFDLEVTKESEDGNVEDFEFTVTNSNGEVVGVMTTNESGWASLKGLPMYKADGVTLETYTLTETRKLPYDELPRLSSRESPVRTFCISVRKTASSTGTPDGTSGS